MSILICGGAGYIGSHAVRYFIEHGEKVIVADNLSTGHRAAVPAGVPFYEGDIREAAFLDKIFTENEIDEMTDILDKAIIKKDDYSRDKHVEEIRKRTNKDKFLIEAGICPKCNGDLVPRNGRYGSFYGCSNYPKCKYVIKPSEIE